ncbi:hypothetical protein ACX8Z9_03390 [Arthrobacter halodurans]
MAKHATLSDADEQPRDGKFGVIAFPHMPKWRIVVTAARAALKGLGDKPSVERYEFTTIKPMPYQIDGEVKSVPPTPTSASATCPAPCPPSVREHAGPAAGEGAARRLPPPLPTGKSHPCAGRVSGAVPWNGPGRLSAAAERRRFPPAEA